MAAGAVLLAVALYFAAQETLVEFKYRVTINCKPQRAFQFLKDPSNIKKLKSVQDWKMFRFRSCKNERMGLKTISL